MSTSPRKHSHYFKDVSRLETIDVYRVLQLFNVTDPCLQHAVKKLLVAGGRGVKAQMGQTVARDVQEAIDTLQRWQEMQHEDLPKPDEQFCACGDVCKGPESGQRCARGYARQPVVA
jgi:hypothetical protein